MKKIKKQFIFVLIVFLSLFIFGAHNAFAANVAFSLPTSANVGDNLDVTVNADTGGILVNSVSMVIGYDQNTLSFTGYSDTNSVIKIWINPPSADAGNISLSGIIPGGVNGLYDANQKGLSPFPVVHLFFTPKNAGVTTLSFVDSKILEDDGSGTSLPHDNLSANITITNNPEENSNQRVQNNPTENIINSNISSTQKSAAMPDKPDPFFWIFIFLIVSGILIYKLLKYKS